jgi:hypothetical protein
MKITTSWIALILGVGAIVCAAAFLLPQTGGPATPDYSLTSESDEKPKATGWEQAHEWRMLAWRDENGNIPPGGPEQALQARDEYLHQNLDQNGFGDVPVSHLTWVSRGPENVGGRTRSIVVHPNNPDILWAGSVGGGIWKSIDGGAKWLPMNDVMQNYAVTCLTLDPNDPNYNTLYAGTGEGGYFNAIGREALPGGGVFKSIDGGITWTRIGSTNPSIFGQEMWGRVARIAIMPDSGDECDPLPAGCIILASTSGGIQRSENFGGDWDPVASDDLSRFVAFDPTNGQNAVAELVNSQDVPTAKWSDDGGETWNTATRNNDKGEMVPFTVPDGKRIEFAYHDTNVVYAINFSPNNPSSLAEVSRSANGGHHFQRMNTVVLGTGEEPIAPNDYAMSLWASPNNANDANLVVAGGVHIHRSTDGGNTFTRISDEGFFTTNQPHRDQHCLVSDPAIAHRVYACTDGAIYETEDIMTASKVSGWSYKSISFRTAQYYAASGNSNSGKIYGGTQDQGTTLSFVGNPTASSPFGGDGGFAAVDPNSANCYGEFIFLKIHRSNCSGGAGMIYCGRGATICWPNVPNGDHPLEDAITENANFIAPFVLDPNDPNRIVAGGRSLWRTRDAQATQPYWESIRGPATSNVSAIAIAPDHPNIIWVAYNDSTVFTTANGLADPPTWTAIDDNQPGQNPFTRFISRILIDDDDPSIVYVAQGGFSDGNLLKTVTGGIGQNAWANITGQGFPDAPVRGIARHPDYPNKLYVGTEIGLYSTNNGGIDWLAELEGPAKVSVDEVTFMRGSTTLVAATHGRGVWTAETNTSAEAHQSLYDFDGDGKADIAVFRPSEGNWYISPSSSGFQSFPLGTSGDIPCAADFDGDGKTDPCVFHPSNGMWTWINSSTGLEQQFQWGQNGDVPVPADFDGDGVADQAVFRVDQQPPNKGYWYLHQSSEGDWAGQFGKAGDRPIPGDVDGDGRADLNVFRKQGAVWWFFTTSGHWPPYGFQWGLETDIPTAADFDGDGKMDVGVWRPQGPDAGNWYIRKSSDGQLLAMKFGQSGDKPVQADYDGDGKVDFAVWRPSEANWYLMRTTGGFFGTHFGASDDIPIELRP